MVGDLGLGVLKRVMVSGLRSRMDGFKKVSSGRQHCCSRNTEHHHTTGGLLKGM